MGFFTRDRAEKVVEYHHFPEPWAVARSTRMQFVYRFFLGRPMDGVRWSNSTFWHPGSRGEASWWLRLAGWQRLAFRLAGLWLLFVLPLLLLLYAVGAGSIVLQILLLHLVAAVLPLLLLDHYFRQEHGVRFPLLRREQHEEQAQLIDKELVVDAPAPEELEQEEIPGELVLRWEWIREGRREWERTRIRPLAAAISERLDNVYRPGDTDWVIVPRNYLEPGGKPVQVMLPTSFGGDPASIKGLERVIANKLGMLDPSFQWQLQGDAPRVLASAPPVPPKVALFASYRSMLEQSQEYRPFLGVVADGSMLSAEMVSDSPHIGLSAGSGAGKSMMCRAAIMQALYWGWGVVILDWKAESHTWAKGLPGVKYVTRLEDIHDMGVRIGEEVDIRKEDGMAGRANVLVVREEWNMTAALLSDYWVQQRGMADPEEKRTMPPRSPALSGFQSLVFAGRQFGMFDFLIAQRMSNRVFNGNTDLRENYQIRLIARYSPQTWKMLIGNEIKPIRKPKELGRWVVFAQDEVTVIQGILITDEEARAFAQEGKPNPTSPFTSTYNIDASERVNVPTLEGTTLEDQFRPVATSQSASSTSLLDRPAPIILRKLVDISTTLEYLGITKPMLQKAARSDAQGDPNFPAVRGGTPTGGYLYDLAEVTQWAKNKRATQAAERELKG